MPDLIYEGRYIRSRDGESVLDALLRQGISIPFSCRNGICHVCMQRCLHGSIAPATQKGLSPELIERGYFMPCKCIPSSDMEIAPPIDLNLTTVVHSKEMLSPHVCKLLIEPPSTFIYRAGQFINLRRPDGLTRSYSLASLPDQDYFLEIHVQRKEGGAMSNWLLDELSPGNALDIQGPNGKCYYQDAAHDRPMLLIGTGTGMAPLYGIVRSALHNRHENEIHLYHGGRSTERFYLRAELREMERQYPNFHYHECISGAADLPSGVHEGRVNEVAFRLHHDLHGWHVFAAGLAEMVDETASRAVEQGANPEEVYTDAFVLRDLRKTQRKAEQPDSKVASTTGEEAKYPPRDPELWSALRNGETLMEVLKDFYGKVYQDRKLSSFFEGVTKQRLIEKQYLFTRQILTGERIYFGDRPRNTHHWMIISDGLFDYRASIMKACLHDHGLAEPMVNRFMEIEEFYRRDIVKSVPFARIKGGREVKFEGFGEIVLEVGALCDACNREVAIGENVIYHLRTGKIYCSDCNSANATKAATSESDNRQKENQPTLE